MLANLASLVRSEGTKLRPAATTQVTCRSRPLPAPCPRSAADPNSTRQTWFAGPPTRAPRGIDMRRNFLRAEVPAAMILAVSKVVNEIEKLEKALQICDDLKGQGRDDLAREPRARSTRARSTRARPAGPERFFVCRAETGPMRTT